MSHQKRYADAVDHSEAQRFRERNPISVPLEVWQGAALTRPPVPVPVWCWVFWATRRPERTPGVASWWTDRVVHVELESGDRVVVWRNAVTRRNDE